MVTNWLLFINIMRLKTTRIQVRMLFFGLFQVVKKWDRLCSKEPLKDGSRFGLKIRILSSEKLEINLFPSEEQSRLQVFYVFVQKIIFKYVDSTNLLVKFYLIFMITGLISRYLFLMYVISYSENFQLLLNNGLKIC